MVAEMNRLRGEMKRLISELRFIASHLVRHQPFVCTFFVTSPHFSYTSLFILFFSLSLFCALYFTFDFLL